MQKIKTVAFVACQPRLSRPTPERATAPTLALLLLLLDVDALVAIAGGRTVPPSRLLAKKISRK
jgi:hypothetical protein